VRGDFWRFVSGLVPLRAAARIAIPTLGRIGSRQQTTRCRNYLPPPVVGSCNQSGRRTRNPKWLYGRLHIGSATAFGYMPQSSRAHRIWSSRADEKSFLFTAAGGIVTHASSAPKCLARTLIIGCRNWPGTSSAIQVRAICSRRLVGPLLSSGSARPRTKPRLLDVYCDFSDPAQDLVKGSADPRGAVPRGVPFPRLDARGDRREDGDTWREQEQPPRLGEQRRDPGTLALASLVSAGRAADSEFDERSLLQEEMEPHCLAYAARHCDHSRMRVHLETSASGTSLPHLASGYANEMGPSRTPAALGLSRRVGSSPALRENSSTECASRRAAPPVHASYAKDNSRLQESMAGDRPIGRSWQAIPPRDLRGDRPRRPTQFDIFPRARAQDRRSAHAWARERRIACPSDGQRGRRVRGAEERRSLRRSISSIPPRSVCACAC
jgi:hypothetical protein